MNKISIRFFNDREVRAIWDEQYSDKTIDWKSKTKAYMLFESSFIDSIEVNRL